jgi:putative hemolysin
VLSTILFELAILLVLTLINGAFAMAEMALVSARKARLAQKADAGDAAARAALDLVDNPTRFLSTVQLGITLVGIVAGAFGEASLSTTLATQVRRVWRQF